MESQAPARTSTIVIRSSMGVDDPCLRALQRTKAPDQVINPSHGCNARVQRMMLNKFNFFEFARASPHASKLEWEQFCRKMAFDPFAGMHGTCPFNILKSHIREIHQDDESHTFIWQVTV